MGPRSRALHTLRRALPQFRAGQCHLHYSLPQINHSLSLHKNIPQSAVALRDRRLIPLLRPGVWRSYRYLLPLRAGDSRHGPGAARVHLQEAARGAPVPSVPGYIREPPVLIRRAGGAARVTQAASQLRGGLILS